MNIELLVAPDPRWADVLTRVAHDVYHRQEYVRLDARQQGGEAVAIYARDDQSEFLLPLILRPLPPRLELSNTWRDAAAPYGYPAPVGTTDGTRLNNFLRAAARLARDRNILCLFLRWHPLWTVQNREPIEGEVVVNHGETVFIDLTESAEAWQQQTHSGHRYEIRRLRKLGFQVIVDDWTHLAVFHVLYSQTMRRVAAREHYDFSLAYFEELRAALGPLLHIATVVAPDGELAAAGLFTESRGIIQYHLSGADERYLRLAPTKLLLDHMRYWAQERGNRTLHLGGGLSGERDSLFAFKAGFSKHRGLFSTSRIVTHAERFAQASAAAPNGCSPQLDGFFPPYRQAA